MKKLLHIAVCMVVGLNTYGQDIHFSQFFFAPQLLNPAETGRFDAQYRFNANNKTQWREVSKPYTTFALSADWQPDALPENISLGLLIMNDRAGDSRFNTLGILSGGAFAIPLDDENQHALSLGLQIGLTQISLDYGALHFNNQFNGVVFDPNLPTGEHFSRTARWFFNLNAGSVYTYTHRPDKTISFGWATHNITQPDQSFFNEVGVRLPVRNSLYATGDWALNESIQLMPAARWMQQSTFNEIVVGSAVRYILMDEGSIYRSVFAGYFGRLGDSGIALVGIEIDDWRFAASYDINMSDLTAASRNRGGFEFSLQYLFKRNKGSLIHKYCPVYI